MFKGRLIDGLINGFSCKYLPLPLLEDSISYKQLEHVLNLYHKIQKLVFFCIF